MRKKKRQSAMNDLRRSGISARMAALRRIAAFDAFPDTVAAICGLLLSTYTLTAD